MPKLWRATVDAHRSDVRTAVLDATAKLVAERGLSAVAMSEVAEAAGIGRATLYKYFADVHAILTAWHERQITAHVAELQAVQATAGDAGDRLGVVLERFAMISHDHHDAELVALLHRGEHMGRAQERLKAIVRDLIAEGAASGQLRDDVAPAELATFCLHALTAASSLPSKPAVKRLVSVTLAGLRRPKR